MVDGLQHMEFHEETKTTKLKLLDASINATCIFLIRHAAIIIPLSNTFLIETNFQSFTSLSAWQDLNQKYIMPKPHHYSFSCSTIAVITLSFSFYFLFGC